MVLVGCLAQAGSLRAGEAAATTPRSRLRIVIANQAGAGDGDLERARSAVGHELRQIGIDVVWTVEERAGASRLPGRAEDLKATERSIMLVLLSSETGAKLVENASDQVLGVALPSASRAYLFYERIGDVARQAGVPIPEPLGYAMLHEIGHLLLSKGHAEVGLMQATLPKLGVATFRQFTRDQETRLRLATRVAAPLDSPVLTASAGIP
jgi:hypothetical protein